jgi:hypothetical protein
MAWIKMRVDLITAPKIIAIASACKCHPLHAVGGCFALWSLADTHTTDGNLPGYSADWLNAHVGINGFAAACVRVGWLVVTDDGLTVPRFDEHNSESAKARAQTALRVARKRAAGSSVPAVESKPPTPELISWAAVQSKRPDWLPESKPWIDADTWLSLAAQCPTLTAEQFTKIVQSARRSRATLANPAGFIIAKIRECCGRV